MSGPPTVAWKILTAEEWRAFEHSGSFAGSAVDAADGYTHLSTAEQLAGTLATHYDGVTGLVLAEVDLAALGDAVRWEASRGGALFPHLYGPLPLHAVLRTLDA